MTLRSDLIAARALIDTPEKWCKGAFRNYDAYCALGACERVEANKGIFQNWKKLETAVALGDALPDGMPTGWTKEAATVAAYNDFMATTHADIMALFQRAIDNAGERE